MGVFNDDTTFECDHYKPFQISKQYIKISKNKVLRFYDNLCIMCCFHRYKIKMDRVMKITKNK